MPAESVNPVVFVMDADPGSRAALRYLILEMELECHDYGSNEQFFREFDPDRAGCLILDVDTPAVRGLQFQQQLNEMGVPLPLVIVSGHNDVSLTVELIRRGASDYLQKPLRAVELWEAVAQAFDVNRQRRALQGIDRRLAAALARLRPRQRDMLRLIAEGADNRRLAEALKVSLRTVEMDRTRIMQELRLSSTNALLHFALLVHPGRQYAKLKAQLAADVRISRDPQRATPSPYGSETYLSFK